MDIERGPRNPNANPRFVKECACSSRVSGHETEVAWYWGYRFCDDVHRRLRQSRQHPLRAVKSSGVRSGKITKPTLKRDTPDLSVLRNWRFGAVNKKGRTFVFRFSRLASGSEECPLRGCAVQRRRFPVGASPTRQPLQPEAIGAVMEVTKWLKPSISVSRIGDSASVQAATRVNAEQSSKRTMCRSTRQPFRGRLIRLDEVSEAIRSGAAAG